MQQSKCPVCGCKKFYVKNPDDEYETYAFECRNGAVCFDADVINRTECPPVTDATETFCDVCAWHDKFSALK
jgi:hypothetical protein